MTALAPTSILPIPAIDAACSRIAPLWPLRHFVAVNPFLGLTDLPFGAAIDRMRRVTGSPLHLPREIYADAWASGRIARSDLDAARAAIADGRFSIQEMETALREPVKVEPIQTRAEFLDAHRGTNLAMAVTEEISSWCAAYFDQGQAAWTSPWAGLPLFEAWRQAACLDPSPELRGIARMRALAINLPNEPRDVIETGLKALGLGPAGAERYLHRQLASIGGWAGYTRQRAREDELYGRENDSLAHLLAVRIAFDLALADLALDAGEDAAWREMVVRCERPDTAPDDAMAVWQEAYEIGARRVLLRDLAQQSTPVPKAGRDRLQAVFCIDVRSEVFRRALEKADPEARTIGFAGFFGFPLRQVPLGQEDGPALCPVLLTPSLTAHETVAGSDADKLASILTRRSVRKQAARAWKAFKVSAVSSFSFVEACGLGYGVKLFTDSRGWTRPCEPPETEGLDARVRTRLRPMIPAPEAGGPEEKDLAAAAANALRKMGLTRDFARLVLLCGHGSSTTNNPYASALDCGACGGHAGGTNARIVARTLNDPRIRARLADDGIYLTVDTFFLAGQHDTTTDEVEIFEADEVPVDWADDLAHLRARLREAARLARRERAASLGEDPRDAHIDAAVTARSRDWAQVRPEWGLAGNAAFIAAPRAWTAGINLRGRVFLHDYDRVADADRSVLELILCAPLVVASWINLQYYASALDNDRFGSGSKVTHNVVGTLGVLQGNGGDLQVGLPWQSVHDGRKYVHEPVRLTVIIDAPTAAIDAVLDRHEMVRHLVAHHWVQLHALTEEREILRWLAPGQWRPVAAA